MNRWVLVGCMVGPEVTDQMLRNVSKVGAKTIAKYGDDFGKMGVYIKNPGVKVGWSQFAEHGLEKMAERGVTKDMIDSIVQN